MFPRADRLLCTWHINKNIASHCKKDFETNEDWQKFLQSWQNIIYSDTEQSYELNVKQFEMEHQTHPSCVQYAKINWLKFKTQFVNAWTNKVKHLGHCTTQRVEVARANLKNHLNSSLGSFPIVWSTMHSMVLSQLWDIDQAMQHSRRMFNHVHNREKDFRDIRSHVSTYAMDLLLEEQRRSTGIGNIRENCGCVLRSTHGLPCAHELATYYLERRLISLEAIDDHWKQLTRDPLVFRSNETNIDEMVTLMVNKYKEADDVSKLVMKRKLVEFIYPATMDVDEPIPCMTGKGRPPSRKSKKSFRGESSTRRNPSGFEYAQTVEEKLSQMRVCRSTPSQQRNAIIGTGSKYLHDFPDWMQCFIQKIDEVLPDGHCGFNVWCCCIKIGRGRLEESEE